MHTNQARIAVGFFLLLLASPIGPAHGASFRFDLTETIGSDFVAFPEAIIDLGVSFTQVERATVDLKGHFRLGSITPVTIPPHTGPALPSDTVDLLIRL